jgi:hypothetical protein
VSGRRKSARERERERERGMKGRGRWSAAKGRRGDWERRKEREPWFFIRIIIIHCVAL